MYLEGRPQRYPGADVYSPNKENVYSLGQVMPPGGQPSILEKVAAGTTNTAVLVGAGIALWYFLFRDKPKTGKTGRSRRRPKALPLPG